MVAGDDVHGCTSVAGAGCAGATRINVVTADTGIFRLELIK